MSLTIEATEIDGVKILTPKRFGDSRGFFVETWNAQQFELVADATFVQDNHSMSSDIGTVRGLHYQLMPRAQGKLLRVVRGRIYDVAVDLRKTSPTFGRHVGVELSAEDGRQLWIPVGFAHGFATREPRTEVIYKTTDYYDKASERGILWNDPALQISWGIEAAGAHLKDQDREWPRLAEQTDVFA